MGQSELLRHLIEVLKAQQVPYMLVGSFASMAYGEPRLTQDIDVVVDLREQQVESLCRCFSSPEYYADLRGARAAVRSGRQFNVVHVESGTKIDFLLARKDAWGIEEFSRRKEVTLLPGCRGYTARPEDVIVGKMLYYQEGGSEKHLRDIAAILQVSGHDVDVAYVAAWAKKLDLLEIWNAVRERLGMSP